MAILPTAVLLGDPGQEWLATAIPVVLQQDLATSASLSATFVTDLSTAYQLQSVDLLRTTVEQRNGRFRVQAILSSAGTQQNRRVLEQEGPVSSGIIPLLDVLARKMDPERAGIFSTRSESALQSFVAAIHASDLATRNRLLDDCIRADPHFGLAQIARLESAPQALESSPGLESAFVPLDRARWLALLARTTHRPLLQQAQTQAAVVSLAPNNIEALSFLGLDRFLLGDASGGESLLRRAIALNPANTALPVQLAQGLVAASRFAEAAKILTPLTTNNANLLLPLALVELLNGSTTAADQTFRRFVSFLPAGNPAVAALESQWQKFRKPTGPLAPAEPPSYWQNLVQQSGDTNLAARAMYAAALEHAGQAAQARSLHVLPFIPEFTDPNAPIAFAEVRRLTGH